MSNYIIAPTYLNSEERIFRTFRFLTLFHRIRDELGFNLIFAGAGGIIVPDDAKCVLAYGWGIDGTSTMAMNRLIQWKESGKKRLIGLFGGIHRAGRGAHKAIFDSLLSACDLILGSWATQTVLINEYDSACPSNTSSSLTSSP